MLEPSILKAVLYSPQKTSKTKISKIKILKTKTSKTEGSFKFSGQLRLWKQLRMSTCLGRVCLIVWRDARLVGLVHVNVNFICSNSLIVPSTLIMYHPWHLQYILESTKEKICSKIVLDMCFYYLYLNWKQSKTHLVATWQKLQLSILPAMLIVIFYCWLQAFLFTHLYLTSVTCVSKIQDNVWTACDCGKNQEKTAANRFEVLVFDVLVFETPCQCPLLTQPWQMAFAAGQSPP